MLFSRLFTAAIIGFQINFVKMNIRMIKVNPVQNTNPKSGVIKSISYSFSLKIIFLKISVQPTVARRLNLFLLPLKQTNNNTKQSNTLNKGSRDDHSSLNLRSCFRLASHSVHC